MTALLPLVASIILYGIFYRRDRCWRSSVLSAAIIWGLCLTSVTEILSIANSITFDSLAGAWAAIDTFLIYQYVRVIKQKQLYTRQPELQLSRFSILLLYGVATIVLSVGVVAIVARPNNWDSMTYHLPRVMHWIQNHHVGYYPTNYLPQLYQKPWTEYVILHLQILSGGDRLANLVQWFSSIGSIIGVSLIAKQLGADARGQILTTVVCATIPMGILQSSSTKNDYVLCFWLICLTYHILREIEGKISHENSFKIGVSLGISILTKGTAYIYVLPFIGWLLVSKIGCSARKLWGQIAIPLILAMAIDLGQMLRNVQLFGNIFATGDEKYLNDAFGLQILISNMIKNISLHIFIPFSPVRAALDRSIHSIHTFLGVNIDDARLSWPGTAFSLPGSIDLLAEDSAPNSVHLLAIAATIVICLTWRRLRKQQILLIYILLTLVAFLLFCLLLKWQPWHSRLHLSLFVLFAAPVGIVLANLPQRRLVNSIAVLLIISSLPWCLFGRSRPLIARLEPLAHGRIENVFNTSEVDRYFANQPSIREPYIGATDFVKSQNCKSIGLALQPDTWEYPFWVLLQKDTNQNIYINHVNPQNISIIKVKEYPHKNFIPCAIIAVNNKESREIVIPAGNYLKKWSNVSVSVFLKH